MFSLVGAAFTPSAAFAACSPLSGNNVTVTCTGPVFNQGPGAGTGYGDSTQDGLALTVQSGASVIGPTTGIDVNNNDTINNFGTINGSGNLFGINGNGQLTVNNSGSIGIPTEVAGINAGSPGLMVTNNAGGVIHGGTAIQGAGLLGVGTATVVNFGLIQGRQIGIDGGSGFADVTNNAGGTITANFAAINSDQNSVKVTNSGTISTTVGRSGNAISAGDTATVNNLASGIITADGDAITAQTIVLSNAGSISGTGFAASAVSGGNVTLTNSGSITGATAGSGISMSTGSVINRAGAIISGDLGISAFGNTTIFNAGTITGTAGTAINFFSGGNTLTLGPGSIINGTARGFGTDTFQLGGTGAGTFNAALFATQYSGYTTFNKIGTSTWTLTGTNATAMPWTISGGRLNVDGTIANSTMTVNAGGTLGGSGTVGSTAITGGTLAPGSTAGSVFGPLAVLGNLSFTAASTYMIQVSPANAGRTNVLGTATLGGATVNAVFLPGSLVNRQYTIVNAANAVSGTFNPAVTSNMANIQSTLSYDAHDAFLNIKLVFVPPPSGSLNANQQNVANALTNFFNVTGGIPAMFAALGPAGLTQVSGEVATGSQQTTFDAMNLFMGVMTDPLASGRGDGGTAGASAPRGYASTQNTGAAHDAYAMFTKAPPAPAFEPRWSVWAAGFGGSQTTDGNATVGSNTATSSVYGTVVGADYRISPFTVAGFAMAGGGTNFSVANSGSGHSDLFQAGAFIRHTVGAAYISAALAYGWQDVTTNRTVTVAGADQLRAQFNANAFSGRLEGGYRFVAPWVGGVGITPYAAAQFTTFDLPAYAEQAIIGTNNFALAYGAKSVTDPRSELGFRTDKSFAMPDGILTLRSRFAWAHDYDPDRSIGATFQTLPGASFVVNGAAQASDSVLTTASIERRWINNWSIAATFEGEFSNVTSSYAGKGVVRYTW
jgi:uncharacterized protein with beta-barrel porin domain